MFKQDVKRFKWLIVWVVLRTMNRFPALHNKRLYHFNVFNYDIDLHDINNPIAVQMF